MNHFVTVETPHGPMGVFTAYPRKAGRYPSVIVLHEAFGLNHHIEMVAQRIAQEGYFTLAPNLYFWEKKNLYAYTEIDSACALMNRLTDEVAMGAVEACLDYLKTEPRADAARAGVTGFCMGGRLAFLAASQFPGAFRAAASFYGGGIGANDSTAPLNKAANIHCPLLLFYGEQDGYIPPAEVGRVDGDLKRLGKAYELRVYPQTGHGFFCEERASYHRDSAVDAWARLTRFFEGHLK